MPKDRDPAFEARLDDLRRQAQATGRVDGLGVDITGGPLPTMAVRNGNGHHNGNGNGNGHHNGNGHRRDLAQQTQSGSGKVGYFGLAALKQPVWTYEISLYFFIGGLSGMAAVFATAALFFHHPEIVRACMWMAFAGGILSPILLIMDLGRPLMFFNMLRVFKPRSPMSMGVYILSPFGMAAIPGALCVELGMHDWIDSHLLLDIIRGIGMLLTVVSGLSGMLLATYTGVLIGATVVPAWNRHRMLLPFHFGTAGMGSAISLLFVLGYRVGAMNAVFWAATIIETILLLWLQFRRHGEADRALHEGRGGQLLLPAEILLGPVALVVFALGFPAIAGVVFMAGALMSRFGWIEAGKASAKSPAAAFASQS